MEIVHGIGKIRKSYRRPVLAIGVFDGLHRGHQRLIRLALQRARILNGTPMAMTFHPHPVQVLRQETSLPLIVSLPHRLRLMEDLGVKSCVVVHFTKRFSRLSPESFIRRYLLDKINPSEIVVGDDFRFGQDRAGTIQCFKDAGKKYGFRVHAVSTVRQGTGKIGSSRIRDLIRDGKLDEARRLLGRPVSVLGTVVRGASRGKSLGYPTANIRPSDEVVLPGGVFLVNARLGRRSCAGIANVGARPSFSSSGKIEIEVHLFDFHKDIYGVEIVVEFLKKIRNEQTFPSREALISQIRQDESAARRWFSRRK